MPDVTLTTIAVAAIHLPFAALWTGSVLFVTLAVLPSARDGTLDSESLSALSRRLKYIGRTGALLTLLTGAHMAAFGYTVDGLLESTRGHLVLGMIVLWVLLATFIEFGLAKLEDGTAQHKVRSPAAEARPCLLTASTVAVFLFIDAGALATGV